MSLVIPEKPQIDFFLRTTHFIMKKRSVISSGFVMGEVKEYLHSLPQ